MSCIHGNVTLREMDAVIQRIPDKNGQWDGLHYPKLPPKAPEEAAQSHQYGHNGDDHRENDSEIMCQENHHQRTEDEGDDNTVEGAIDSDCLDVNLHPVVAGLEGWGEHTGSLVQITLRGGG